MYIYYIYTCIFAKCEHIFMPCTYAEHICAEYVNEYYIDYYTY